MPKLYDTTRKTQVAVKPTVSFLQDLNLILASTGLDASEIIRQSVRAQADGLRRELSETWAVSLKRSETSK